ncbi:MAG TPA: choice-of-anchor Q domain-containing protein [Planctomycetota bacterium]|nr:choice-of-anchor Q domain-containing protein [Planctomycetota bacterium]
MIRLRTLALAIVASSALASAQTIVAEYYVNGRTGIDRPDYGTSPDTPWKTFAYAIPRIPPVANPDEANRLNVEGDQVYSTATNGETFPIRPVPNLWIEGTFVGHGRMPVLQPPPGGTAMRFDPTLAYSRNPSTMRYLVFDGGAYGVEMGHSTQRHRPRFQDCTFQNQSRACVHVGDAGSSRGIDPRFFQTLFRSAPRGIEVIASTPGAVVFPDVGECTFTALGTAVYLDDTSSGGNVGGLFRTSWFRQCDRGVHVRSGPSANTTNFEVWSSRFADIRDEAVFLEVTRPPDPTAHVELSQFVRCGTAIRLAGMLAPGPYTLRAERNAIHGCQRALYVDVQGAGSCLVSTADNLIDLGHLGVWIRNAEPVQLRFESLRDRILDMSEGVYLDVRGASSSISVQSALICRNTTGLRRSGIAPAVVRSVTFADNSSAFETTSQQITVDHCVFAGNAIDVSGVASFSYCCFQSGSQPGAGNLNFTDPQLLRPFYKLAPTSPCIDRGNVAIALPPTDYEGDPRASVSRPNGSALPDLGADEYVQLGSAHKYGVRGFGFYDCFPEIGTSSTQFVVGGTFAVELSGAILPVYGVSARDAFLTFGLRDDAGGLPFDLNLIGAPGSLLWNELNGVVGLFPVTQGRASVPIPIPGVPLLTGHSFTFQWWVNMFSANPNGPVTSDGLRVTVGG